jgi:hypothetical protein
LFRPFPEMKSNGLPDWPRLADRHAPGGPIGFDEVVHTSPPIRVHSPTACVPLRADSGVGRTSREEGRLAKRMNQERLLPTASHARETGPDHIGVGKADVARIKVGRVALRRQVSFPAR